jgi:hypothetical protein
MATRSEQIAGTKLMQRLQELMISEQALREECQVDDKYRSITNRLKKLEQYLENHVEGVDDEPKVEGESGLALDVGEQLVFVYFFNAHGQHPLKWSHMINGSTVREAGAHRPIYSNASDIDTFIRGKKNAEAHAYLVIKVQELDIIDVGQKKDPFGYSLVTLKDGSLKLANVLRFVHVNKEYEVHDGKIIVA